jgi:hypothetical protein
MSTIVNTQDRPNDYEKWDKAIRDAQSMLERTESKAERLKRTISSLTEYRDAGEPWLGESQTDATRN